MSFVERLDNLHRTTTGYVVFGVMELMLAGVAVWIGLRRGNILAYVLAGLLLIGVVLNTINAIEQLKTPRHE
jgi:putative Mn2+ efflux pump MntP